MRRRLTTIILTSMAFAIAWPQVPFASAAPHVTSVAISARDGRAPIRFNLLAASWTGSTNKHAVFRTSPDGEAWSAWTPIEASDQQPDGTEGIRNRVFTEPAFVGDARFVQTRGLFGTRLHFINVNGDADDPGPITRALRSAKRWATGTRDAGAGPLATAGVYIRSQWGADESLREQTPPLYANEVKMAIIHHTDTSNAYTSGDVPGIIRGIYYYHVKVRGFRDIAYNFLADHFGRVWEGRWGGVHKGVVGAHSGGFNTGSIGIAMIGNFQSAAEPSVTRSGIARLLSWKFTVHHIHPLGYAYMTASAGDGARWPPGTVVRLHTVSGHRDVDSTSCPGTAGYGTLQNIRDQIFVRMLTPGVVVVAGSVTYRAMPSGISPIPSAVLPTWIASGEQITMSPAEISWYTVLPPLNFRNGTLVQGDTDPTTFLVSGGKLRPFTDNNEFISMGFSASRVLHVPSTMLASYPQGPTIEQGIYPDGVVLRSVAGGPSYMIVRGLRRPVLAAVQPTYRYTADDVVSVAKSVLDAMPIGPNLPFRDGTLMRSDTTVYYVSSGQRHAFVSAAVFHLYGFNTANIRVVANDIVLMHPIGVPVTGR